MKKGFLLVSLILSTSAFAQLTLSNEPAIGEAVLMYKADPTSAYDLSVISAITGEDTEWDYSGLVMVESDTKTVGVVAPSSTSFQSDFPTSTKVLDQGVLKTFYTSSSTGKISQGFVYNEPTLGDVVIKLDTNPATMLSYPMDYGQIITDYFAGETVVMGFDASLSGNIYSQIDGTGTLKLPTMDIEDVFRLTIIDTAYASVVIMPQPVPVIRIQHEYYKLSEQNLPIFTDVYITIVGIGEEREIASKYFSTLSLDKNQINNVKLFPNPSNGSFTVTGEFANGNVVVTDLAGKEVFSSTINAGEMIQMSDVTAGIYLVNISANGKTAVQKMTVK